MTKPVRTDSETDTPAQPIAESAITARAYELWQVRGCPIGSPEVDWFQAEQDLRSRARTAV